MKKIISLTLTAIILCVAIALIYLKIRERGGYGAMDIESFIPADVDYVVAENVRCFGTENISIFDAFESRANLKKYASLIDSMYEGGVVTEKRAERIAFKRSGEGIAFIALYRAEPNSEREFTERLATLYEESSEERIHHGLTMVVSADSTLYALYTGDWLAISNDGALMRGGGDGSADVDTPSLKRYFSEDAQTNLFVGRDRLMEGSIWGAFDVDIDEDGSSARGYVAYSDTAAMELFVMQEAASKDFDKFLPASSVTVEWLNLTDPLDYLERVGSGELSRGDDNFENILIRCASLLAGNVILVTDGVASGDALLIVGVTNGFNAEELEQEEVEGLKEFAVGEGFGYAMEVNSNVVGFFGAFFTPIPMRVVSVVGDMLLFATSESALTKYIAEINEGRTLDKVQWYRAYKELVPLRFTFSKFAHTASMKELRGVELPSALFGERGIKSSAVCGMQGEYISDYIYLSVVTGDDKVGSAKSSNKGVSGSGSGSAGTSAGSGSAAGGSNGAGASGSGNAGASGSGSAGGSGAGSSAGGSAGGSGTGSGSSGTGSSGAGSGSGAGGSNATGSGAAEGEWRKSLNADARFAPVAVKNHNTGATEWFVQDRNNLIYLLDASYKKLWQANVDGAITSDIVQVDCYKNGRLQILFSTDKSIYLIDRNGVCVKGYPVHLPATTERGITLCDYEKDKNYRIFAPCTDQKIYLYGIDGKRVSGWGVPRCNDEIASRVEHIRIGSKDFILVADLTHLYIWNRKGEVRVKCDRVFDFQPPVTITKDTRGGAGGFLISDGSGRSWFIDSSGKEIE